MQSPGINFTVQSRLREMLLLVPNAPDIDHIKWQGRSFVRPPGEVYWEEIFQFMGNEISSYGAPNLRLRDDFLFAVNLYHPFPASIRDVGVQVDSIFSCFNPTTHVVGDGFHGMITARESRPAVEDSGWYLQPVNIFGYVHSLS